MLVPIIKSCEVLVLGTGIRAMVAALQLSKDKKVLLVGEDTSLYADIVHTADYRLPTLNDKAMQTLLFPEEVRHTNGQLHPDLLKRYGERLFQERGIELLYGLKCLGTFKTYVIFGHKGGMFAVEANETIDQSAPYEPHEPASNINIVSEDAQIPIIQPTAYPLDNPRHLLKRFLEAAKMLPSGARLARSGTKATEREGINITLSESAYPIPPYPIGDETPVFYNPLYQEQKGIHLPPFRAMTTEYDVVIIGGGTSGAPAAIQSARMGMKTLLIEMNRQLGGTGTVGGVNTYWFGLRNGITKQIDEKVDHLYRQLKQKRTAGIWSSSDAFLSDIKAMAWLEMCTEAGVEVSFSSTVFGVSKTSAEEVTGVYYARNNTIYAASAKMFIDCTGDGDIAVHSGAAHTYGEETSGFSYWASLAQYTSADTYRNNFSTMVHLGDPIDITRFIIESRKIGENLFDHGSYVAVRESRHIKGMENITLSDILRMRQWPETIYTCFSNYDPKGYTSCDLIHFGLLPPNQIIPIPLGAVIPVSDKGRAIDRLLVGGKAISATHDAFPALRMQPDLQNQGCALAILAALSINEGVSARNITNIENKMKLAGFEFTKAPDPKKKSLLYYIKEIKEDEPWEWLDMDNAAWVDTPSPITSIMLSTREEVVPKLQDAYEAAKTNNLKLHFARLLLWHGDESGVPAIIANINQYFSLTASLPRRQGSINYGQLLPDHGLMPEAVYLLNSLSRASQTDVTPLFTMLIERLERTSRDWHDLRAGIYCYVDCLAYVAKARKDKGMCPLLWRVLSLPEFNTNSFDKLLEERFLMLRVTLLSALYCLGETKADKFLMEINYHNKRVFREAAKQALIEKL